MTDDLVALERRIIEAVAAAKAKGWRDIDLAQAAKQLRHKPAADLYAHLSLGIGGWRRRRLVSYESAHVAARHLLATLLSLREIPRQVNGEGDAEPGVLAKVRALLAKAESTTFPAEADALNAKACELMQRHAIDASNLRPDDEPVGVRRIFTDDPYAKARFQLLGVVAHACRCRAIWSSGFGFAHVFGEPTDLAACELLFTSLLAQATTAMLSSTPGRASSSSTAAYRRAFLVAFASRVGERLAEANAAALLDESVEAGCDLSPALVRRELAAERALRDFAPSSRAIRFSVSDGRGWAAGSSAADRASLQQGPLPKSPARLGAG